MPRSKSAAAAKTSAINPSLGNDSGATLSQRHSNLSTSATPKRDTKTSPALDSEMEFKDLSRKSQWIALAVMSGACAAFNGVFAKLTTTELTTTFATWVAKLFGLGNGEKAVEVIVRGFFFVMNLVFNAIMWALFTKALARGTSTTQVSIINTSTNFLITAIMGFLIFSESLPPLWFLGAAFLVAGNVIIGRREEKGPSSEGSESGEGRMSGDAEGLMGEDMELEGGIESDSEEAERKRRERAEDDDILDLGSERRSEDLLDLRP